MSVRKSEKGFAFSIACMRSLAACRDGVCTGGTPSLENSTPRSCTAAFVAMHRDCRARIDGHLVRSPRPAAAAHSADGPSRVPSLTMGAIFREIRGSEGVAQHLEGQA